MQAATILLTITAVTVCPRLGLAAPATPPPCEPLPAAAADTAPVRLDDDGDGIADLIIPTDCDGRASCTLAVFLTRGRCASPLGSVKGDPGALARTKQPFLPLTSHGIRLLWTHEDLHHAAADAAWAWTGDHWANVFNSYASWDVNHPQDNGQETGVPDGAAACLDARRAVASPYIDDDTTRDAIYRVPCATPDDVRHGCGLWVAVTRGRCRAPIAVLADGAVEVVQRAGGGRPAVLRVRSGSRIVDYRLDRRNGEPAGDRPPSAGISLAAVRTCTRTRTDVDCAAWEPVTQP